MTHQDWYGQRYSVSQAQRQKAAKKKSEKYAALNEFQKSQRQANIAAAQLIFTEHGIPYEEKGNGWLVTIGGEQLYFYPSTNKWRPKGGKTTYYSRSAADFIGKVLKFQLHTRQ